MKIVIFLSLLGLMMIFNKPIVYAVEKTMIITGIIKPWYSCEAKDNELIIKTNMRVEVN